MKITRIKSWSENLELTRPYSIAFQTFDSVENVFVYLETDGGLFGLGSGAPVDSITGESLDDCTTILADKLEELLLGKDIRLIKKHCRTLEKELHNTPAARAAVDIALHDVLAKHVNLPLVDVLGREYHSLPTSITIGIKSVTESVTEAGEYIGRGFRILKVKTGNSVEEDIERIFKIREKAGAQIKIRVDANQGYTVAELLKFEQKTRKLNIEFIEQPLKSDNIKGMYNVPDKIRKWSVADESLQDTGDALNLAVSPKPFGIYNIKLMKCGGINSALQIAEIANLAKIDLMWGCMDESIISISAALHAALASPATRYLDLDGSLDLARDLVSGGFILNNGYLSVNETPGLGCTLLKGTKI
ncbi:MAG: dipeptide epimerase [Bacteroidetes bacterium]|nr:dipeptide epimerase [Bacteroidota bacterium]